MKKYFKKGRKIMLSSINKYHSLGLYYFKMNEYNKAIEFFKKALIVDPDHADSKEKIKLLNMKNTNIENQCNDSMLNAEIAKSKSNQDISTPENDIYCENKIPSSVNKYSSQEHNKVSNVDVNSLQDIHRAIKKNEDIKVSHDIYINKRKIQVMIITMEKYYAKYGTAVPIDIYEFSIAEEITILNIIIKRSDIFYNCTHKKVVLVKWIIDEIKEMFNRVDKVSLLFPDIYSQLRFRFKNHFMNRKNLKKLLLYKNKISTKDFDEIAEKYEHIYETITNSNVINDTRENDNCKTTRTISVDKAKYIANYIFKNEIFSDITRKYNSNFDENEMEFCRKLQEAKEILGKENCIVFSKNINFSVNTHNILRLLIKTIDEEKRHKEVLIKLFDKITDNIRRAKLPYLIDVYASNESENKALKNIFIEYKCIVVGEINKLTNVPLKTNEYPIVIDFLHWISNIKEDELFNKFLDIFKNERDKKIFKARAKGNTLEKVGNQYGITRERVRQLEKKITRSFIYYIQRIKAHYILLALSESENIISDDLIKKVFREYSECFKYALRKGNIKNIKFNEELQSFVFDDTEWQELVELYINDLPQIIECKQIDNVLKPIFCGTGFPIEYKAIKKIVLSKYLIIGNTYSKTQIGVGSLYLAVIKKYYPNGIKLFDKFETKRFKIFAENMFGEVEWPNTDRAISARIADRIVLCGRGRYILPNCIKIDDSLLIEIHDYIKNSERNVFLFHELFERFKEKLLDHSNINNRFFLQGVLKYKYSDEFLFNRDTVAKEIQKSQNIGEEIEKFIKSKEIIATKSELKNEFLGITEIVINSHTTGNKNILLWGFGEYIHISKLILDNNIIDRLSDILTTYTNQWPVSAHKLFNDLYNAENKIFLDNHIENHVALFSLLEYLFEEEYEFSRPYIASKNSTAITSDSIIQEFLSSFDELTISELKYFVDNNHIEIMNFSNLIDRLGDKFIRVDRDFLIARDKLNLSDDIINRIEETLLAIMGASGYISARLLDDFLFFPSLGIKWTPYFLVSIIKSLGKKINVFTISTDYRYLKEVFVDIGLGISNYEEFLHYAIKTEHNNKEFKNLNEIEDFLKKQNLIFKKIPKSLFKRGYLVENEYVGVKIM